MTRACSTKDLTKLDPSKCYKKKIEFKLCVYATQVTKQEMDVIIRFAIFILRKVMQD